MPNAKNVAQPKSRVAVRGADDSHFTVDGGDSWHPFPGAAPPERAYAVYWCEDEGAEGCHSFASAEVAQAWCDGFSAGTSEYGAGGGYAIVHGSEEWAANHPEHSPKVLKRADSMVAREKRADALKGKQ